MRESDRRMWSASMTVALTRPCSTALTPRHPGGSALPSHRTRSTQTMTDGIRGGFPTRGAPPACAFSRQHLVEQGHADEQAVARLPEVCGARIAVEFGR